MSLLRKIACTLGVVTLSIIITPTGANNYKLNGTRPVRKTYLSEAQIKAKLNQLLDTALLQNQYHSSIILVINSDGNFRISNLVSSKNTYHSLAITYGSANFVIGKSNDGKVKLWLPSYCKNQDDLEVIGGFLSDPQNFELAKQSLPNISPQNDKVMREELIASMHFAVKVYTSKDQQAVLATHPQGPDF